MEKLLLNDGFLLFGDVAAVERYFPISDYRTKELFLLGVESAGIFKLEWN